MAVTETQIRELIVRAKSEGFDATKAKIGEMAEAQRRLAQASGEATKVIDLQEKRQLSTARALDQSRQRVDESYRALREFEKLQMNVERAQRGGYVSQAQANQILALGAEKYRAAGAAAGTMGSAAGKGGKAAADGARLAAHEIQNLSFQLNDAVTMLASGSSPFQVIATQGGQVYQILSGAQGGVVGGLKSVGNMLGSLLTPARAAGGVLAGAAITAGLAWKDWADGQSEVRKSLLGIGAASGATVGQINAIAEASAAAGNVSQNSARQMASAFAATGKISPDLFSDLIGSAKDFGKIIGEDAVDAAKVLGQAMAEPGKGAERLNATLGAFDAATLKRIQSLEAQNRMTEAQRLMIDGIKSATEGAEKATTGWSKAWDSLGVSISNAWAGLGKKIDQWSGNGPVEDQKAALEAQLASLEVRRKSMEDAVAATRATALFPFQTKEAERDLEEIGRKIEEVRARIGAFDDEMKKAADQAARIKANLESLRYIGAINIVMPEIDAKRVLDDRARLLGGLAEDPVAQRGAGVTQDEATRAAERAREAQRSYRAEAERSVDALRLQAEALNARSPAEKAAVAAKQKELELQGSNLSAAEKQLQIDLARSNALREATKQLQDQARERQNAVRDQIGAADAEIAGIGKTAAEAELLRLNYQSYVDLRREAEQNHTAFDQAQFDALRAQNAELVKRNQLLRERKFVEDALFERSQLGRTSEDQRIASSLRSAGLPVDLNSTYAQLMRMNDALAEMKDVSSNALSTFMKDLKNGKSASEALTNALDNLADKAIDKLSDQIVSNLFSAGGQGFTFPNIFGAPQAQAGQPAGGVAGFLGSLFGGGKTAGVGGTMTVSAGIVYVNGAVAGGVLGAAGLGGAANSNVPGSGGIGSDAAASARAAAGLAMSGSGLTKAAGFNAAVDNRLLDILNTAATRSGLRVDAISGFRPGDPRYHGQGLATDIRLFDQGGRALGNYQDPSSFRTYEAFAQQARAVQMEKYPELADQFRWGGYFSGERGKYGALDTMHFDLDKRGVGMGGGSWEGGLNQRMRSYWGADSVGMGQGGVQQLNSSANALSGALGNATNATTQFGSGITDATKTATSALTGTANASQTAGVGVASLGTGAQTAAGATDNFASGLGGAIQQIVGGIGNMLGGIGKGVGSIFGGFFGFEAGGIMTSRGPLPLNFYANGGVAMGAQVAVFGEGRIPEAYVPLPDGRRIPVALSGGERGTADELRAMAAQAQAMEGMMVAANSNARAGSPVEAGPQIHFHNAPPVKESRESTDEQGRKRMDVVFEEQTARALGKTGGPARRALTRPMKYT